MCVMMTEIQTIDGGQEDALLKRANIKKYTHRQTGRQTQTHRHTNIQVKRDKVLHFFVLSTLALTVNEGMCIHPT